MPDGGDCDHTLLARGQLPETFVQPLLRFPGNKPHLLALMLLPFLHGFADQRFEAVMPSRFREHAAAMGVATFGDAALYPFVTAGVFAGS